MHQTVKGSKFLFTLTWLDSPSLLFSIDTLVAAGLYCYLTGRDTKEKGAAEKVGGGLESGKNTAFQSNPDHHRPNTQQKEADQHAFSGRQL
jgi:hypothetical protein